ncbi:myoneurin-like [Homarus americanus]|uniref:myoneurin-like n=1 Tax=Homarus americanus TaxID=6706 RepID=UPI001C461700|nr:myoneurin-like [Homarus americanus]
MVSHAEEKVLKNRMVKRAKKKQTCNECNQVFITKKDLLQHRRKEHHARRENVCSLCNRTFESDKRLKMHASFHYVGEYECFYCQKQFNKAWKMKIHLVNHSGRPPYICQFCGDDFLYPGKIVNHLKRIHDVWYACKDCGEALNANDSLYPHKCKVYGCKDCLMSYDCKSDLAKHVKCHINDDKPPLATMPVVPSTPPPLDHSQLEDTQHLQPANSYANVEFNEYDSVKDTLTVNENGSSDSTKSWRDLNTNENTENNGAQDLVKDQNVHDTLLLRNSDDDKNASETDDVIFIASDSSLGDFKVPETTLNLWKRCENPVKKSLRIKQDKIDKSLRKQDEILNKLQFYVDTDAKLTQRSQISFESWLTNDAFNSADHDFVFGFEASVSVSGHQKEPQHYFFNKKVLKKEKSDMNFEDLCYF